MRENGAVRPDRLSDEEADAALARLPGWTRDGVTIRRSFELPTFADAVAFVVRIGFHAEKANHHPDIDIRWRAVTLALTTHDVGGLTELDLDLARAADTVAAELHEAL